MDGEIGWWRVCVVVASADVDHAAGLLWLEGPAAVHEQEEADRVRLEAAYADEEAALRTGTSLRQLGWIVDLRSVTDEPWLDEWRAHAQPVHIARSDAPPGAPEDTHGHLPHQAGEIVDEVVVVPAWLDVPAGLPPGALVVRIDPGRAFGHGAHPTSRLAVQGLLAWEQPGDRVLDLGCGSGVLAVVAALLGGEVVAVDIDPAAVAATRDNATRNAVAARIDVREGSTNSARELFDVVVANIGANALIELAPDVIERTVTGGLVLVGGFLTERSDEVTAAYERFGASRLHRAEADGWSALTLRRG